LLRLRFWRYKVIRAAFTLPAKVLASVGFFHRSGLVVGGQDDRDSRAQVAADVASEVGREVPTGLESGSSGFKAFSEPAALAGER